ncbi:MAG: hypothetical protein N4A72_19440 [Bacteroidales bacterium]|jgi:hypothetical protein|nr:hypothetical protein [Bacteroidales bacterium]
MDFTVKKYTRLIKTLKDAGYVFKTYAEALESGFDNTIVLRHDVDKLPDNSLLFATIQNKLDIRGSYYFRIVPESYNTNVIKDIADMHHEIGYHYEDLTLCNGNVENAYESFVSNLNNINSLAQVKTICMHGSPMSKWDSKDIWKEYSYKELGIIGEPYFDTDFNSIFYITDTGRRWNGDKVSVRDKVASNSFSELSYSTTDEIINAINNGDFPKSAMFTFHPQRWTDNKFLWAKELVLQRIKNIVKRLIYVKK